VTCDGPLPLELQMVGPCLLAFSCPHRQGCRPGHATAQVGRRGRCPPPQS
jgi:hypothetical protein